MSKDYIEPGNRIMDRAYHRDELGTVYTGEALLLVMLLRAKGKGAGDDKFVRKLMKDQNIK